MLEVVNVDDHLVLKVVLDSLRCRGFDDRWLGLVSFPGTRVLEAVDEVSHA